jgi:predicted outer membrane repeat protein
MTCEAGGAVYHDGEGRMRIGRGSLTFICCVFMNNSAELGGGAIFSKAKLTLLNCWFENNTVNKTPPPPPPPPRPAGLPSREQYIPGFGWPCMRPGGAIHGRYVDLIGCTFKNNIAIREIYAKLTYGERQAVSAEYELNIKDCVLIEDFD